VSFVTTLGVVALRLFAELVAPSRCAACDARVSAGVLFCTVCAATVERVAPSLGPDRLAAFEYGGAITTAITRLKYEDRPDLAPRLGEAMLLAAAPASGSIDLVVPVPLHPRRLAERGYNQSALLARPVARALGTPLAACALRRLHDTPRQARLDRTTRLLNVRRAFATGEPTLVRGRRILLVDDVRTTGATLEGCTAALNEAGARQVLAIVFAQRS
jgi:ComF family protein